MFTLRYEHNDDNRGNMDFLRKILLIAISCVFTENTEGMQHQALPLAAPVVGTNVLDFDTIANVGTNIPAVFQPKIYEPADYNVAEQNNLRYVYFNVITPGGAIVPGNVAFQHAAVPAIVDPNLNGGFNIFFPMDGRQPTIPEAVEYSCANIDNTEDSPITKWYMKMFGVIPFNENDYIKAGWKSFKWKDNRGNDLTVQLRTQIISFDTNVDNTQVDDPYTPSQQIGRRKLFVREFRKIASTSVGRVLLYRILIEIRRHTIQKGEVGDDVRTIYQSIPYFLNSYIDSRNSARSLLIKLPSTKQESWNYYQKTLTFDYNHTPNVQSICDSTNGFDYIVAHKSTIDTCLFHELLHWYHFLRDPSKYRSSLGEGNNLFFSFIGYYCWKDLPGSIAADINIDAVDEQTLQNHGVDISKEKISAKAWSKPLGHKEWVDTEELETILGNIVCEIKPMNLRKPDVYSEPLNGSDLSENLYRICVGIPLRFGYSDYSFYEDSLVIERIMALYNMLEKYYLCNTRNKRVNREKPIDARHGVDYLTHWIRGSYKKGLGKCRVSRL